MTPIALTAEQDFAGRQAVGKRSEQEDAYAFSIIPGKPGTASGLLVVVSDGMGGHAAGACASDVVVRSFAAAFYHGGDTVAVRFAFALDAANQALGAAIDADPDRLEGMGATLLAAAVTPLGLEWISVGDSPLYIFRRGQLRRVNADHSFRPVLREMVARGELREAQAAASSLKNRLRAALIGGEIAIVDVSPNPLPLIEGDVVLAGSDGLQTLSDEALADALAIDKSSDAAGLALHLIHEVLAAKHPKQDNITAAIIRPSGEWLLAPFAFAPLTHAAGGDDTTQPLVPRSSADS